jgi:hypothetical protein
MKNNLMRAAVFIVLGTCLLIVSIYSKNSKVELWSSFFLGLSFPLYIGGIISIVKYFKQPKQEMR